LPFLEKLSTPLLKTFGNKFPDPGGVNSYCMLHFIYRLNLFGGKDARQNMRNRSGFGNASRGSFESRGMRNPENGFRNNNRL